MDATLICKQVRSSLDLVVMVSDRSTSRQLLGEILTFAYFTTVGTIASETRLTLKWQEVVYIWCHCVSFTDYLYLIFRLKERLCSPMFIQEHTIIAEKLILHILAACLTD